MTILPRPFAPAPEEAIRKYETRRLCIDGWFWPLARAEMRHGLTIRARMLEEIQILSLTRYPDEKALAAMGWTPDQIATHAQRALDTFFHVRPPDATR